MSTTVTMPIITWVDLLVVPCWLVLPVLPINDVEAVATLPVSAVLHLATAVAGRFPKTVVSKWPL